MICITLMKLVWIQPLGYQINQNKLEIKEKDIKMKVKYYKDGIYRGDYGITYFVLNNKILMKHFGNM